VFKEIVDARTHGRWSTDNGPSQKLSLRKLCSAELKTMINNICHNALCLVFDVIETL